MKKPVVNIVGGGLAGTEIAYQLARRGFQIRLYEMRPQILTPAHRTGQLAELVCSNSFKSTAPHSAPGILKNELSHLGSLLMQKAPLAQVPAGEALAVDRDVFAKQMESAVVETNAVERIYKQVQSTDDLAPAFATVIATGPLTQGGLAQFVQSLAGNEGLYFYDAIAPVVEAESVDRTIAFTASRYGKGSDDYLNCPFTKEEYDRFYDALMGAEKMEFHDFEDAKYFQGCQPIEAVAETGRDSLRFGCMKPVGLTDPRSGRRPFAAVQLRIDNLSHSAYNIVGFQTKLKYPEQKRVFQLIPGLEHAEFLRLGSMHRNTYICTPTLLDHAFRLKTLPSLRFAGQITGVEGYVESSAIGLLVAISLWCEWNEISWMLPPSNTALGSLCQHLFFSDPSRFQPFNVHFGLFEQLDPSTKKIDKRQARILFGEQCLVNLKNWSNKLGWKVLF